MSGSLLNLDLKNLKLPAWLGFGGAAAGRSGSLRPKYPPVAMDLGIRQLALARLSRDKDRRWTLTSFDQIEVPEDVVESDIFRIRITSAVRYRGLIAASLHKEGVKTDRISLVVPDHMARVALLPFEELPRTRREVTEMVRWKMKKAVPFKVEEAVVDYEILPGERGHGFTVLVVLMPQSIVEEQEAAFLQQGIRPGLVDLSTFSLLHLYRSVIDAEMPAGGDFMLLNATGAFFTVMILRDGLPIFYRCKTFSLGGDQDADGAHRLLHRELQASLVYYQERLNGHELARVYMRLVTHDPVRVASLFQGAPVASHPDLIDPRRVVRTTGRVDALGPDRASELMQRLAPALGAALGRES